MTTQWLRIYRVGAGMLAQSQSCSLVSYFQ
jgi:hypothetical protein